MRVAAVTTRLKLGTGILQMPGVNNVDLALLKDTTFHERYRVEFRSEFFNAFNHTQFGVPQTAANTPLTGVILTARDSRQIHLALKFLF